MMLSPEKIVSSSLPITNSFLIPNSTFHTPTPPSRYAPCPVRSASTLCNPKSAFHIFNRGIVPPHRTTTGPPSTFINSPSPSLPIPRSCFFPTFPPSPLLNFFLSAFPPGRRPDGPYGPEAAFRLPPSIPSHLLNFFFPTFSPSHLLIFPTSFFPVFLIKRQIWFKRHIWRFLMLPLSTLNLLINVNFLIIFI
jgi:hypothetical protein